MGLAVRPPGCEDEVEVRPVSCRLPPGWRGTLQGGVRCVLGAACWLWLETVGRSAMSPCPSSCSLSILSDPGLF